MEFATSDSWVILSPIEQGIKKKIMSVGTPLSQWDVRINYGIKTGLNNAFIISTEKKDELIAADPRSAEIIRPILRGRDIKRYNYTFADLWLIFVPWHFPLQNDESITGVSEKAEYLFKERYPAVYNHLLLYKEELSKRNKSETGIRYEWYALQRWGAKYWNDFFQQKIVYREISDAMDACLVEPGIMLNNKCYLITGEHLEYLLAFFNSKIFTKIILPQANITGGKGESFLSSISSLYPTEETEAEIHRLLQERSSCNAEEAVLVDKMIDEIFFSLYDLNASERSFLDEE